MTSPRARRGVRAAAAGLALASALVVRAGRVRARRDQPARGEDGRAAAVHARRAHREGGRDHDQVELTVPTASRSTRSSRSPDGRGAVAQAAATQWSRFIWTGGHVPTDEDAVFRFHATLTAATDYMFDVRQTTPTARSSTGPARRARTRRARSSSAVSLGGVGHAALIVALVLGGDRRRGRHRRLLAGRRPLA